MSLYEDGSVWYSRYYGYNLDGSRAMVMRDDAVNGSHWDVYSYDEVSGRLASVQDVWTGEVNSFAWNPEGTLARWSSNEPNSYARVFGYDEEGRLVKIERDYGSGGVQVAYEYGYNSDGARVWKRDVLNQQEYRYVCRIGCGGVPMRVYNRPLSGGSWASVEDYISVADTIVYSNLYGNFVDYSFPRNGDLLIELGAESRYVMIVRDSFGHTPKEHVLNFPPPLYLLEQSDFSVAIPMWVVVIAVAVVAAVSKSIECYRTAKRYQEELDSWPHNHSGTPKGGDKLVHCVTACLIGLDPSGGLECALLAALSTERGGNPFGRPPTPGSEGALDEKANLDGVDCASEIKRKRRFFHSDVSDNDWLECQWCCHQRGYRRWH